MQRRVEQAAEGGDDVVGAEGRAVGVIEAVAQMEGDGAAVGADLPRGGELGLELLRLAVDAHQHAAGQVQERLRGLVIDQQRVKGLGLGAQAEAQFGRRRKGGRQQQEQQKASTQGTHQFPTSFRVTRNSKLPTTAISSSSGASFQYWPP